jgi:hypothetical protein
MGRILSQGEIDALLHSGTDDAKEGAAGEQPSDRNLIRYNFRRPDRVSKDQIHALGSPATSRRSCRRTCAPSPISRSLRSSSFRTPNFSCR